MMQDSDRQTVFEDLFKQHYHQLYIHALGWVREEECAKDIVHDSFCYLWEHFDRYADTDNLLALLYSMVRSRSIDSLRHEQIVENYAQEYIPEETDEYSDYDERLRRVMAAIRRFSPQMRRIFTECVLHHKTYKETAAQFGISPLTVKTVMARAFKSLREQKEFFSPVAVLLISLSSVII